MGFYLGLSNYVNNWKRLGFTDADVEKPGSDKLIDAVVAHGTAEAIAARLAEHLDDGGADHVTIQVLGGAGTNCCRPDRAGRAVGGADREELTAAPAR